MTMIDGYTLDAAIHEDHVFDSDVTSSPVEEGSDITDNVRPKPIVITLDCVVSNSPVGVVATLREPGVVPADDAYARLKKIRGAREPVTVTTTLGTFENMALTGLSVPVDAGTGDALRFRAVFQQIEFVTNARTTIKVKVSRSSKKVNRGTKPAKDATPSASTNAAVKSGYEDTWMGQITDELGITSGPDTNITGGLN